MEQIKKTFLQLWTNRAEIMEGIANNVFKKDIVEKISQRRLDICINCELFDDGEDNGACIVPGTTPCCNQNKGGCGCSLAIATRSLSYSCPLGKWGAEMTPQQEDQLNFIS